MESTNAAGGPSPIRVFLVAPFEPVRVGLRGTFQAADGYVQVVGDSSSLAELLGHPRFPDVDVLIVDAAVLNHSAGPDHPHIPGHFTSLKTSLKVLFIGSPAEAANISAETLRWVVKLDAVGFLYRDGTIGRVVEAVKLLASGAFLCEREVVHKLFDAIVSATSPASTARADDLLSEREVEVLALVARGLSNREIATQLFLSEGTIKAHISHIMAKLGAERRTELVRYAVSRGLDVAA